MYFNRHHKPNGTRGACFSAHLPGHLGGSKLCFRSADLDATRQNYTRAPDAPSERPSCLFIGVPVLVFSFSSVKAVSELHADANPEEDRPLVKWQPHVPVECDNINPTQIKSKYKKLSLVRVRDLETPSVSVSLPSVFNLSSVLHDQFAKLRQIQSRRNKTPSNSDKCLFSQR